MQTTGTPEQVAALYAAIAQAQAGFDAIKKTARVSFFSKKMNAKVEFEYADYDTIRAAIGPALAKHGLSIRQPFETLLDGSERVGRITTILSHQDGASEESEVVFRLAEDIKDIGGQTTYIRRYAINCHLALGGQEDAEDTESLGVYQGSPGVNGKADRSTPKIPPKKEPAAKPEPEVKAEPKPEPKAEVKPEPKPEPEKKPSTPPPLPEKANGKYTPDQGKRLTQLANEAGKVLDWTRPVIVEKIREVCKCEAANMTVEDADNFIAYLQAQIEAKNG